MKRIIVGISGASGAIYGIRLLELLRADPEVETHLVMSSSAKRTIRIETDWIIEDVEALASETHNYKDVAASISSGSFLTDGMIIAPWSLKTLSGIGHCYSDNLLIRAADVVQKEGRRLVVMPREVPLNVGHCKLLYEAAQMGVHIAPPMPSFYNQPKTIDDLINHSLGRVLDLFAVDIGIVKRWDGAQRQSAWPVT